MQIKVKYETTLVNYEVSMEEIERWLDISIEENETLKEFEDRVNEKINNEYNKSEYNNWHKFNRHLGKSKKIFFMELNEYDDNFEPLIDETKYTDNFFKAEMDINEKIDMDATIQFINSILKPEIAELFIAIKINKEKIKDYTISKLNRTPYPNEKKYQDALLRERNNNTKKLKRATEKIKENFYKAKKFGLYQGINIDKLFIQNENNKK